MAEYQGLVDELFSLERLNLSSYHFPELKTKELYCCRRGIPGSKFIAQVMFIVFSLNDSRNDCLLTVRHNVSRKFLVVPLSPISPYDFIHKLTLSNCLKELAKDKSKFLSSGTLQH